MFAWDVKCHHFDLDIDGITSVLIVEIDVVIR